MFGKLKEKLKGALSVFSSKAVEEAEVAEVKPIEVEIPREEKKREVKKTKEIKEKKSAEKKKPAENKPAVKELAEKSTTKKKSKSPVSSKSKAKSEPEIIVSEEPEELEEPEEAEEPEKVLEKQSEEEHLAPLTADNEELKEAEKERAKEEKKGFFGRLFSRKKEEVAAEKEETPEEERKKEQKQKEHQREEQKPPQEVKTEPIIVRSKHAAEEEKKFAAKEAVSEEAIEKKSFFGKIKQTLTTRTISPEKYEELFWELELVLLENNVSVEVINKIKKDLAGELVNKPLPRDVLGRIEDTLKRTLKDILSLEKVDLLQRIKEKEKKPFVIAFFGINGAGKTTSIAKLAYYLQKQKLSVVLAACDTFRAAAIQQLEEHAQKLNVKMIKHDYGSDAAAVAFDAVKYAEKNNLDVVLIDTAGRLHSNTNLMGELGKILRVTKPDLKIFVGESITGNDCVEQARKFNELVEMDGVILTKADVDEKGGAPLSISYTIKKPILFLGVGQTYDDFEEFNADVIVKRLGF
ncbi:signal recognition particle-docking protein FtsY [Candidatus Woesearchaeota archaeon]|nr:signal recognition particle-docking protein FtsY [Candidatus Woesearchaeota archaeon]